MSQEIHAVRKAIRDHAREIDDELRNWPHSDTDLAEMESVARALLVAVVEYRRLSRPAPNTEG